MSDNSSLEKVKSDFRNFLYLVWKRLNLPDPTPVQYDIAQYLQHGPKRGIIEAFRGAGKSWETSAFVCWLLLNDPQLKILVVSASKERADAFTTFTKRLLVEIPVLNHLQPGSGQRDSSISFDVRPSQPSHAPSVKSCGLFGQLAGSRADVIIGDDVEVPSNSMTQTMRDRLSEAVKEFDAILKPDGRIMYLGTPQCEMTLYNELQNRGYQCRIWPARFPDIVNKPHYKELLAPMIIEQVEQDHNLIGQPTDPLRFDEYDLLEREASYGKAGFALQFMLDTSLSDAEKFPLKLSDLIVMGVDKDKAPVKVAWCNDPRHLAKDLSAVGLSGDRYYRPAYVSDNWEDYQGSVMAIDPSGRGKDETSYAVVKMLHGQLFVTKAGGVPGGYDQSTLTQLASIAAEQKVNLILIESNFGDGMFTSLFKPILLKHHAVAIEEVRHNQQKEMRIIDTLEPVINQHRLIVGEDVVKQDLEMENVKYQLFYQMTRICRLRGALVHDDRLDVLAMAVAYWVEQMDKDTETNIKENKEKLLQEELNSFMENALGQRPSASNWINIR